MAYCNSGNNDVDKILRDISSISVNLLIGIRKNKINHESQNSKKKKKYKGN